MTVEEITELAKGLATQLGTEYMRRDDARLYSHFTRLRNQQPGLPSWGKKEAQNRLQDVRKLLVIGRILKDHGDELWRRCYAHAGQILEWLSNSTDVFSDFPLALLGAAAYDIAGYPAKANALLTEYPVMDESRILHSFLRGNIVEAMRGVVVFWEENLLQPNTTDSHEKSLPDFVHLEAIRAIGVVCNSLRWNNEGRLDAAILKLEKIAALHAESEATSSWILARLVTDVAKERNSHSWRSILQLPQKTSSMEFDPMERYCRLAFLSNRTRAWPSQEQGVRLIKRGESFALCTPTGSGKTSVAEIALLDAILKPNLSDPGTVPLALYIVPSRALAAEVENKLSRALRRASEKDIVVTGLYGGIDWGPTDAWLTAEEPTVVICTFEKADALLRFLGHLLTSRLTSVIFDEAHSVQFDDRMESLRSGENRPLRLESFAMRISQMVSKDQCRLIALSAVASGLEESLHRWIGGSPEEEAVSVDYRSTRQLIGRLLISPMQSPRIYYDILDGHPLNVGNDTDTVPYIENALPLVPPVPEGWDGSEKSIRPALLWAALHFAAPDARLRRRSVLISATQKVSGYAHDFLELIEKHWHDQTLPAGMTNLSNVQTILLNETLQVCEDYFGKESYEYRLLGYGIAIHHANMPKNLSRRVIELISTQTICIVLATSTLSEGINLPVETILVPSLHRGSEPISLREFKNLAGRAGRPGVATEGRTLVVAHSPKRNTYNRILQQYHQLIERIPESFAETPSSPMMNVLRDLDCTPKTVNLFHDFLLQILS